MIGERFALWCALHKDRLPYFLVAYTVERRFDLNLITPRTDDPLPWRIFWRRIFRPPLREDGSYIHGRAPLTVGRRFRALQAIKRGDSFRAMAEFYRLPAWLFWLGRYGKVNKLSGIFYLRNQQEGLSVSIVFSRQLLLFMD